MDVVTGKTLQVTVIDMQPITPAVGGGRQRLLGLYHALGQNIACTYVGSYDWPGESLRDQQLTPGLREIVVPLSASHHKAAAALSQRIGGRTVIDSAFSDQVHLSPDYLRVATEHIVNADIVVFSHPWGFFPLADALQPGQLVVYDSHNVEALLRTELLGDLEAAEVVLETVIRAEQALLLRADIVLACSEEDVALFQRIFDTDPAKLRIVPNGAFVENFPEPKDVKRLALREKLKLPLGRPVAVFLGSFYEPNNDAARFIARQLAPACPGVFFAVVGGVGAALADEPAVDNLMVTGRVNDTHRDELLLAADIALNPMNAGSGTNIKMFDYMAAGLPVLTTEIGARGIGTRVSAPAGIFVERLESFASRCVDLVGEVATDSTVRQAVRDAARRRFSWERISKELGILLSEAFVLHGGPPARQPRIAMMTTWNIACGIGEHSAYLTEALAATGAKVIVLANSLDGHQPLGFERDLRSAVSRVWRWDNVTWRDSGIDQNQLDSVLNLSRPDLLVIQHHTGYVPFVDIELAAKRAIDKGIRVVVEMHDGRNMPVELKERLCAAGVLLVAHHADELNDLSAEHQAQTLVWPLPILARSMQDALPLNGIEVPSIGGFGFLRPYKGLLMSVRVLALLHRKYPTLRYRGWHALYPGDESEDYLRRCLAEADRLGVRELIDIDTRFLPIDEVQAHLSTVSAVLMPYDPSEEGGSAATNLALAARRPIVTSPSSIFRSVSGAVCSADRHTPEAYAELIDRILAEPVVAAELRDRASSWVEANSYTRAAQLFLNILGDTTNKP